MENFINISILAFASVAGILILNAFKNFIVNGFKRIRTKKLLKKIPNAEIKQAYIYHKYSKNINWDLDTKKPINQKSIPKVKIIGCSALPRVSISLRFLDIFFFKGVSKTIQDIKDYLINGSYNRIEWSIYNQIVTYKSKKTPIKFHQFDSIADKKLEKEKAYKKFLKDFKS